MPYKIAIASGKGGTGKTTVAVNLWYLFRKHSDRYVGLVDCDVEEPNALIFFDDAEKQEEQEIFQMVPEIDIKRCTFCRKCVDFCEFNALVVIPPAKFAEVNSGLCHSCGACLVACPEQAISEFPLSVGKVTNYKLDERGQLIEGMLKVGSAMQTMLIKKLKKLVPDEFEIILYDSPPGTSCSVVETLNGSDYVVLVSEPTPFGLYDLKIMTELLGEIKKPFGIVINKAGVGNNDLYEYIEKEGFELLGELPFDETYAGSYARGSLFRDIPDTIRDSYRQIVNKLETKEEAYRSWQLSYYPENKHR
jgi:MinD superfamily P-loop ATPase